MITVVGDCMRDVDRFYAMTRLSDDGYPVAGLYPDRTQHRAGGALAVAEMLNYLRVPYQTAQIPAWQSLKERVIVDKKVIARFDSDCTWQCSAERMRKLLARLQRPRVVCVVDHGKGMITEQSWKEIVEHADGCPIVVDKAAGKKPMFYNGATIIKGNDREWGSGGDDFLRPESVKCVICTNGSRGVSVSSLEGFDCNRIIEAFECASVVDCCGAGDMITAVLAGQQLYGIDLSEALELGVELAAAVCTKWGAVPPSGNMALAEKWHQLVLKAVENNIELQPQTQ